MLQPDLFAAGVGSLMAEVRRHGGGERPRFITDAEDNVEEEPYFSPVQFAEEIRSANIRAGLVEE